MGNLLKDGLDYVKQTVWDQPKDIITNVAKGKPDKAFSSWKHTFGDNNDMEEKLFNDVGIRGWVGSHPTETAGAAVGSIFGGIYAAGAYGATAAGGAAASGAGSAAAGGGAAATGSSALGGVGAGAYLVPASSGGVAATGTGTGIASSGALSAATANAPSTMALINMGNAGMAGSGAVTSSAGTAGAASGAGMGSFSPALLGKEAAASAITSGGGAVPASYASGTGKSALSNPDTWSQISRLMNSVKPSDQDQQQLGAPQLAPGYRGSFNFDRKAFQNQALTKTYSDLYNSPTRAANIKF
ncbi:hypothetical protein [Salmonella phage 7-11]|uniref:Uncharacterized protein n=1 Tax=Salmonella phage 7-11 TaxID=1054968 RepID=G0X4V4_9CAUD|nr:hypothetical protein SaPh711_gp021 [Salmonella phage 7-11]AEK81936.1 hypothetical protein [Salmonella phage 7-11]